MTNRRKGSADALYTLEGNPGFGRIFPYSLQQVLTMFVTSFANFGTIGIIVGIFKGLLPEEKASIISKNVVYMMLSGILVSLLTAAMVGLFIW